MSTGRRDLAEREPHFERPPASETDRGEIDSVVERERAVRQMGMGELSGSQGVLQRQIHRQVRDDDRLRY